MKIPVPVRLGVPIPFFVVDCNTDLILDANPRAEETLRIFQGGIAGRVPSWCSVTTRSRECLTSLNEANTKQRLRLLSQGAPLQEGRAAPFYVNMHACPISYGGTHAMIVAVTDITEMMEKDAQLVQAAKMKTLGEMSAGIAHEINQPAQRHQDGQRVS